MALQKFMDVAFHRATLEMIHLGNEIIDEMAMQGYTLTLRQLYYQLVSKDVIRNKQSEYKRLGEILSKARLCGLVDWNAIEDRTRRIRGINHRENPSEIIADAASAFRLDKWKNQRNRVEVWVEKDALVGVLEKACDPLDVSYFSSRGNTSSTAIYGAHERFIDYCNDGQQPVIIHLADHDPTGIDMTRDIIDRLCLMVTNTTGHEVEVRRIALNMDQVKRYNPPPNPAKESDSRYKGYVRKFGKHCWELDALNPRTIDQLITKTVLEYRDEEQWEADKAEEDKHRELLANTSNDWDGVSRFVENPNRYIVLSTPPIEVEKTGASLRNALRLHCEGAGYVHVIQDGVALSIPGNDMRSIFSDPSKTTTSIKSKRKKKP